MHMIPVFSSVLENGCGVVQNRGERPKPYQGEDLIYDAQAPGFLVRCTRRSGPTPGICLYERWIDAAKLIFRFPREWLNDWHGVAANVDRLIATWRPTPHP
jgi:hypothetical protein